MLLGNIGPVRLIIHILIFDHFSNLCNTITYFDLLFIFRLLLSNPFIYDLKLLSLLIDLLQKLLLFLNHSCDLDSLGFRDLFFIQQVLHALQLVTDTVPVRLHVEY